MNLGRNRAQTITRIGYLIEEITAVSKNIESSKDYVKREYCVFLSYYNLDKTAVREIANYIMKAGIDIYLDENDIDLQMAYSVGNHVRVTQCIQKGIKESTHILCLLSPDTVGSWWVPYELGYGENANKKISSLKLKILKEIPSYLKVRQCLNGIDDLNKYIKEINKDVNIKEFRLDESASYNEYSNSAIVEKSDFNHPLNKYLDT